MSHRILVIVLLAGLGLPALCQQPQTTPPTKVPDYILYHEFFFRVKWLSDLADKYSSRGKPASADYFRSLLQKKAGLTAQEDAALKSIAADCRAGDLGIVGAGRALVKAGAAANDPRLPALGSQRQQWVTNHVSQIRDAMGPARFPQLDSFVRASSTAKRGPAAPAPK